VCLAGRALFISKEVQSGWTLLVKERNDLSVKIPNEIKRNPPNPLSGQQPVSGIVQRLWCCDDPHLTLVADGMLEEIPTLPGVHIDREDIHSLRRNSRTLEPLADS
jgi:hypothetical protein